MIAMMDRWHVMPSVIMAEDIGLLRVIEIERQVLAADPEYWTRQVGGGEP